MRVLLVSPNRERLPDPVFPLGLAYVASALVKEGHEVRVLDLMFCPEPAGGVRDAIAGFDPEVVGLSIRNIDDVSYPRFHSYLAGYKEAVAAIRASTGAPLVLGGSGFTIMPGEFMEELGADYGIAGEGEEAFPALLKDMGGKGRVLKAVRLASLGGVSHSVGLFDARSYYSLGGMLNVQTKRGCSFGCIYCTYPRVEGRKVRLRSPGAVADEIRMLVEETGAGHFFIVDSVFNNPPSHAEAVCEAVIERRLDIEWTCYCSPSGFGERLAFLMAEAGCTGVEFGSDSLVESGLKALNKSFTFEDVGRASAVCRKAGLKFCQFLFVGSPGDTLEIVRENLKRLDGLSPDAAVIMAGIRVFPGTRLEKLFLSGRPGLEPVFYIEPEVMGGLDEIRHEASRRRNWVVPGLEINMCGRLQRKLRGAGIKGPLWEGLSLRARPLADASR